MHRQDVGVLEWANPEITDKITDAASITEIINILQQVFVGAGEDLTPEPESEYGLKVRGKKARENLNEACKEVLGRVHSPNELSLEDKEILLQYSGRGGLTENSQFEYYTPTHVAEGVWDAMKAHGFQNGHVLDPCCGAGVFSGTKPSGTIISANDLDPVGSKITSLLNEGDYVSNDPFERIAANIPDNTYDSCVGNVPFGTGRGAHKHEDPAYKNERHIEKYFITRILDKVKPGGLVCLVCPINIVGAKGRKWEEFRIEISKKAEFLGAHKLPSKTFANQGTDTVVDIVVFKKHGAALLDEVHELPFETLTEAKVVWQEFVKGKYWQGEGKKFIMGTYVPKLEGDRWSRESVDGDIDNTALKQKLAQKFQSRIDWDTLHSAEPITRIYSEGDRRSINGKMYVFAGGAWEIVVSFDQKMNLDASKYGASLFEELCDKVSSAGGALSLSYTTLQEIYTTFPDILSNSIKDAVVFAKGQAKDAIREQTLRGSLIGSMILGLDEKSGAGKDVTDERNAIQEIVTAEIEKYGHPASNKSLTIKPVAGARAFGMFKSAVDKAGNFSDLLTGKLVHSKMRKFDDKNPADIINYLFVRQGIEDIHIEELRELYKGDRILNTLGDVADIDDLAITPDGRIMPIGRYCAGNVYTKIAECSDAIAAISDDRLKNKLLKQIEIMRSKASVTKAEDITFGLQAKWFNKQYVLDFLRENGFPKANYVVYKTGDDGVRFFEPDINATNGEFIGIGDKEFLGQFQKYMNGAKITSSKEEMKSQYIKMAQDYENLFGAWMQQHAEIDDVTDTFNRKFNSFVPYEYEGDSLDLGDIISGEIEPHTYQNAEVRRLSEEGCGICGFGVGLGKSFTALALAAYNTSKKGRSKKMCFVVPSAVLENWYHEARVFYSEEYFRDNVFFVGLEGKQDKDGKFLRKPILDEQGKAKTGRKGETVMQDEVIFRNSAEEIHGAMWKTQQSAYPIVVMSKEKFASIPLKPDTRKNYTQEMVSRNLMSDRKIKAEKESAARTAASEKGEPDPTNSGNKKTYAEDVRRANLEGKFSGGDTSKKGELPYFEDLGFDSVITDESHFFKNSFAAGKESQGIAYLPTAPVSQIATDMSMKSHYLRDLNGGRGVYGLTATPVTNSPIEIYNMLSLFCPFSEFEERGISTPDDFIRVFGEKRQVSKVKVDGTVSDVTGLVGFQNLDGLRNLFHKYVNVKTVDDVDGEIHVPFAEELEENVDMSEEQAKLYKYLKNRATVLTGKGVPLKAEELGLKSLPNIPEEDSIFSIIRDMDRLTTDIDMFHRTMTFVFPQKHKNDVALLASRLPETVTITYIDEFGHEIEEDRPSIREIEDDTDDDTFRLRVNDVLEKDVIDQFNDFGIVESEIAHPVTPKYAKMMENLKKHFEASGKQIIFTEERTQHQKIRRIIVHHLPVTTEQIGIINAKDASGDKLDKIVKAYNSGAIKIVIANKKAEVGVNLQKGTTAIHHLTLPWTPASISQRNGRGVRQGNTAKTVDVYYYCGKGTFDSYRKDLLKAKAGWINDLLMGKSAKVENGDAVSQDEILDMLADNPEEAKRMRAERLAAKQEKDAENDRRNMANRLQVLCNIHENIESAPQRKETQKDNLESKIETANRKVARLQTSISYADDEAEKKAFEKGIADENRKIKDFTAKLEGLDAVYEAEAIKLESRKKQTQILLRAAEKEGKLPFNASLIDNPRQCIVDTTGQVFAVGDCFEVEGEYLGKVAEVSVTDKTVLFDWVSSEPRDVYGPVPLTKLGRFKRVSYSESELVLKKVLMADLKYQELPQHNLTSEQFFEHVKPNVLNGYYPAVMVMPSGKYSVVKKLRDMPEGSSLAYPDISNEVFKQAICKAFLDDAYEFKSLARALLGENYAEIAREYGNNATETELIDIASSAWLKIIEGQAKGDIEQATVDTLEYILLNRYYRLVQSEALNKLKERGYDNIEDLDRALNRFCKNAAQKFIAARKEKEQAEELIKANELRNDPRFKEIPNDMVEKFLELGITIRMNTKESHLPGFRGRGGTTYEPFSRYFLQDKNGIGGTLHTKKEILKSVYDASFTKDWEFDGAWWHIPASKNLENILSTLTN